MQRKYRIKTFSNAKMIELERIKKVLIKEKAKKKLQEQRKSTKREREREHL